jgi:hypothetical protein
MGKRDLSSDGIQRIQYTAGSGPRSLRLRAKQLAGTVCAPGARSCRRRTSLETRGHAILLRLVDAEARQ